MRAILLLALAGVVGCGGGQAAPTEGAPTASPSIVAEQGGVEVALANALAGAPLNPANPPAGFQVTIAGSGGFNGTYTLVRKKSTPVGVYPAEQVYDAFPTGDPSKVNIFLRLDQGSPSHAGTMEFQVCVGSLTPTLTIGGNVRPQDGTLPLNNGGTVTITPL